MAGTADTSTTEALWQEFAHRLRGFIAARVADPEAVDDILQEVFLKIHRRAGSIRDSERVTSWVFQVARNAIIDHYRAAPRRREQPMDEVILGRAISYPSAEEPDEDVVRQEVSACLAPLLEQLRPIYREALELVERDGLTQAEAAAQAGISLSGMKSRVQRGRAQLHASLGDRCAVEVDARGGPLSCEPQAGAVCSGDGGDAARRC